MIIERMLSLFGIMAHLERNLMKKALLMAWQKAIPVQSTPIGVGKRGAEEGPEGEPPAKRARTLTEEEVEEAMLAMEGVDRLFAIQERVKLTRVTDPEANGPFGSTVLTETALNDLERRLVHTIPDDQVELREAALSTFWRELFMQLFSARRRRIQYRLPTTGAEWRDEFWHTYQRRGDILFVPIHVQLGPEKIPRTTMMKLQDDLHDVSIRLGFRGEIAPGLFLTRRNSLVVSIKEGKLSLGCFRRFAKDEQGLTNIRERASDSIFAQVQFVDSIALFMGLNVRAEIESLVIHRRLYFELGGRPLAVDRVTGYQYDWDREYVPNDTVSTKYDEVLWVDQMSKMPGGTTLLHFIASTDEFQTQTDVGTFAIVTGTDLHQKPGPLNRLRVVSTEQSSSFLTFHSDNKDYMVQDAVRLKLPDFVQRGGMPRRSEDFQQREVGAEVIMDYRGAWRDVSFPAAFKRSTMTILRTVSLLHPTGRYISHVTYIGEEASERLDDTYDLEELRFDEPWVSAALLAKIQIRGYHVLLGVGESGRLHVMPRGNTAQNYNSYELFSPFSIKLTSKIGEPLTFAFDGHIQKNSFDSPAGVKFVRVRRLGDISALLVDEDGGLWAWGPEGFFASAHLRRQDRVSIDIDRENLKMRYVYRQVATDMGKDLFAVPPKLDLLHKELAFTQRPYLLDFDDMDKTVYLDSCSRTDDDAAEVILVF